MSLSTPLRLKDAARILRGVALVAAKAAADNAALRRAGRGDVSSAVQEAVQSISRQAKQLANVLDSASQDQTGFSLNQQLQKGTETAQRLADALTDRTKDSMEGGQAVAEAAVKTPRSVATSILEEGKQALESASQQLQQFSASSSQVAQASLQADNTTDGLAEFGNSKILYPAADGFAAAGTPSPEVVQPNFGESAGPSRASGGNLQVDFSASAGTIRDSSFTTSQGLAVPAAGSLGTFLDGRSLIIGRGGVDHCSPQTNLRDTVSSLQRLEGAAASDAVSGEGSSGDRPSAASQAAANATKILQNVSTQPQEPSLGFHEQQAGEGPAPRQVQEAAELAEEERRLSVQERTASSAEKAQIQAKKQEVQRKLKERRVPSSPIGRVAGFAQLGASLVYGTVADQVSSYFRGGQQQASSNRYLTERNAERLADALCRMRGAALKLGQMISIQDESVLPPQLSAALERVRAGADVMPKRQLHRVLSAELGNGWRAELAEFQDEPLAAASIGQVHAATLHDGRRVVLKIQYPGVARSIESDVDNLLRIISLANILPKGLYVENAARVAKKELKLECDYSYEGRCQARFAQLIREDPDFQSVMSVPAVIPALSSGSVLCSEWVPGVHIDKVAQMSQNVRDAVGTLLLQLTLRELFEWRFMQTDPNWGNFLYDEAGGKLHLIDFGAAREFPVGFVDDYLLMVKACAERDKEGVIRCSTRLGFLTGDESRVMLDAHSNAGFVVGTPFSAPGLYDFASHSSLTKQVSELGAVMLRHRLTPPPEESYSLHRKLSGAFLACIKLRAKVPCRDLFYTAFEKHKWGHQGVSVESAPDLNVATM